MMAFDRIIQFRVLLTILMGINDADDGISFLQTGRERIDGGHKRILNCKLNSNEQLIDI